MMVSLPTNNKRFSQISYHCIVNLNKKLFSFQTKMSLLLIRKLFVIIVGIMNHQKINLQRLTFFRENQKKSKIIHLLKLNLKIYRYKI